MKTILIVTLALWIYGAHELILLLNNFNNQIAHGELIYMSNKSTPNDIMKLQDTAHKLGTRQ